MTIGSRPMELLEGSPHFHIKTIKLEDGTWQAIAPSHPNMGKTVGTDEVSVVRQMRSKLELAAVKGELKSGG